MTTAIALSPQGTSLQANLSQHLSAELAAVLPATMRPERLVLTIVQAAERNPALYQARPQSMVLAVLTMGVLGLEADGVTGQGYLVPFAGVVQPIIGYRGYNTLAARNGWTVTGQVVREGDRFDYTYGTNPSVDHRPRDRGRGQITHAWAAATRPGFAPIVEVLDIDEVMAIKGKSPGARKKDSPWNDRDIGFPAMAAKSARRRLARSMPMGWANAGSTMEEQWDMGRAAYVERDPDDGAPVVTLARDTAVEPMRPAPRDGALEGGVVMDWPLAIPGRDTQMYSSPKGWAEAMTKKLRMNAKSPKVGEFWKMNAECLQQLGEVDEQAAEKLVAYYRGLGDE